MEKLICTACGAPLTPDTTQPFLTCEYCDTAIENKFYVEPAPEPVKEPEAVEAEPVAEEQPEESSGGNLLQTLLGVGTAIAGNALHKRSRATIARHMPVARTRPIVHHVKHMQKPVPPARPARPARPSQLSGIGSAIGRSAVHSARPGRPMGASRGGRGGFGPAGRGPGGRGPGGRGR